MARPSATELTAKQIKAAETLASPEWKGNITELCKEIGVSRKTYYDWLDNPLFVKYVDGLIDKYSDSELMTVWKSLINKVELGDTSAIKLYFEVKGRYKQQIEISGPVILEGGDTIED